MLVRIPMRYAVHFSAHRLGGRIELCIIRVYALSEICVMGVRLYTQMGLDWPRDPMKLVQTLFPDFFQPLLALLPCCVECDMV